MQNINIKNSQDAIKAYSDSANAYSGTKMKTASVDQLDAFEKVEQVQYDRNSSVDTNAQTVMDNFNEYRKDMQEKAKQEQQEETSDEEQARADAREIARSLTSEEIKKLRMMGVDVASASLSDIEGLVTSMRADAHKDALANVLAQAQIEEGDVSNLVFTSSGAQIAGTGVKLQVGNKDILYLLKNRQPLTQETLYKAHYSGQRAIAAVEEFGGGTAYAAKQAAQQTISRPQQSAGQSVYIPGKDGNADSGLQAQLAHVIMQAGFAVDETSMAGANLLLANDIPVTTDSVRAYMQMQAQIGKDIGELPTSQQAEKRQTQELETRAAKLRQDAASITAEDVAQAVRTERPLTIAALVAAHYDGVRDGQPVGAYDETADKGTQSQDGRSAGSDIQNQTLREVTALRQLEEIRLSMTQSVAVRMLSVDINIDTRELAQVVAKLRNAETQLTQEMFAKQGVAPTEENKAIYQQMQADLQTIGTAPAARLGVLAGTDVLQSVTVHGFAKLVQEEHQIGGQAGDMQRWMSDNNVPDGVADISTQTIRRSADFAAMERGYEALGTAPRADMGDSIRKAFSNIEDILTDMELPVDEEHTRAVQILGYNRMEITEKNIAQIIEYDRAVNDMLAACHPNAVLSMIRDGINPLDMTVDELNQTLRNKNYKAGVKETDDFATYLRDVEKRGQISSEERAGYIGLYRVFKQLEKSGDREAGYLFANNSRLTVRNLITAMRSRKAAGMEAVVDDSFGMLADLQTRGEKMDDQIARAYAGRVGADGIPTGQIRMGENDEYVSQNEPMAVQEEYKNPWETISDSPTLAQAEQLLWANDIEESAQNLEAADYILQGMSAGPEAEAAQRELVREQMYPEVVNHQPSMNFYTFASQVWKQIGWQDHTKEDAVDAETDAMAKSLDGEEIALPFESELLLKQIEADADLAQMYADIRQQMVEQMYDRAEEENITSDQLQGMKVVQAGFRILGAMADRRQYQLPVETESGMKVVNLTMQTGGVEARGITIRMEAGAYGMLQAQIRMDEAGTCTGEILGGSSEANTWLAGRTDAFRELLAGSEYADAAVALGESRAEARAASGEESKAPVVTGESRAEAQAASGEADTQKLCRAAIFFVKAMAKLTDI